MLPEEASPWGTFSSFGGPQKVHGQVLQESQVLSTPILGSPALSPNLRPLMGETGGPSAEYFG